MIDTVDSLDVETLSIRHPQDRCDRCGAKAFILAVKADKALYFCGHHGRKHLDMLTIQNWQVLDDTDKINESPSVSANAE
jgi:hypothetical protein